MPCRDCTDRYIGCHSKCRKYKKWKKDLENTKEKEKKIKSKYNIGYYHK